MGPITVSRAPDGSVVCGILDFYGGWGGPEPVGAPKRADKHKIRNVKKPKKIKFYFLVFQIFYLFVFWRFLGLLRARDPPNHHKS